MTSAVEPGGPEDELRAEIEFLRRQLAANRGAHHMALADSRLETEEAEAQARDARAAERRRAALLDMGDRMRDGDGPVAMALIAAETVGVALRVERVGFGTMEPDGGGFTIERDWTAPDRPSRTGRFALGSSGSYFAEPVAGGTLAVADAAGEPNRDRLAALGVGAFLLHPVAEDGRLVALLCIDQGTPRPWSTEEVTFARDVAERIRGAIERRRAEEALRGLAASLEHEVEERTRDRDRLWRLSNDIMVVAELDTTIIEINPAWTATLGWTAAELQGVRVVDLVHADDLDRALATFRSLAEGQSLWRFDARLRHKDGRHRWVSWTAAPGEGFVVGVARDVTAEKEQAEERAALEEQLRQSQKMEAVGQLTGGIAHDFNNLLTGITGALDLVRRRLAEGRSGEIERYVGLAMTSAQRAAALTHRLLAFSRRQPLDPRPVDGNHLVASIEELLRRTLGETVVLEIDLADGLWATFCDPHQLENALLNLCINARDAMPDGGTLRVTTSNSRIDLRSARERDMEPGAYVTFTVTDTGTGMPPEVIARAFDPFFTTKPIGQGTGLGLSMIYGFARQSNGHVAIHSEVGRGTTMRLDLPRHAGSGEVAATTEIAEALPTGQGETVLVVDDEDTVRMLVAEVLGEFGYRTLQASDGSAGLEVLRSSARIDLLVTDVGLPGGINGRQVADAGRVLRPDLKVLLMTGYADVAALGHASLEANMHLMTKPFSMEALAVKVRAIIAEG